MFRWLFAPLLCAACLLLVVPTHRAAAATPVFVFTAIPDQDASRLVERFSRVAT